MVAGSGAADIGPLRRDGGRGLHVAKVGPTRVARPQRRRDPKY